MILKLTFTEDDYVTSLLYGASKSKVIKRNQLRSLIIVFVCFVVLGLLFRLNKTESIEIWFYFCAVLSLLIFPAYQSYYLKNSYTRYVKENNSGGINKECIFDWDKNRILSESEAGKTEIFTKGISQISEIETHIFVKFKSGNSLIIPKAQIDQQEFWIVLDDIINENAVQVNKELDWKWK